MLIIIFTKKDILLVAQELCVQSSRVGNFSKRGEKAQLGSLLNNYILASFLHHGCIQKNQDVCCRVMILNRGATTSHHHTPVSWLSQLT